MEISFWQQRWDENQIGFHLPEVNPYLVSYRSAFELSPGARVLVPLCGKSLDMIWLAQQGFRVLGVECSRKAIEAFIEEQQLSVETHVMGDYIQYRAEPIELLEGDFFKLQASHLEGVELVYDRASLVALPADMRQQYIAVLRQVLPREASILLVTLEYDQSTMPGPPFSVADSEVRQSYRAFDVELLHEEDIIQNQPRFRDRGPSSMVERVYKITP